MPIYEYECRRCKERFEVLQKMNDDNSHLRCPKCNAERSFLLGGIEIENQNP